jgi:hypothetical protein
MDPDASLHALAARQHGLITVTQATRAGLTPKQIRVRIERGVIERRSNRVLRFVAAPRTAEQHVLDAVWTCGPSAIASHTTAAWLHGFDGMRPPTGRPHVLVLRPARGNRNIARVHETSSLEPVDRTTVSGIPASSPTRTLIDLAAIADASELEQALDGALRDRLTTPARLRWRLEALGTSGRAGCATLLHSLDADVALRSRSESWLESECLRIFRDAGLPTPEVQRVVRDRDDRILRADFAFASGRLVAEVSGHATHATRRQRQADAERRAELALLGIIHVEFTFEDVTERSTYLCEQVWRMIRLVGPAAAS